MGCAQVKNTHKEINRSGLCSSVRGVGTEGRCTKAFVLLLKLFTLRLTASQVQVRHGASVGLFARVRACMRMRLCVSVFLSFCGAGADVYGVGLRRLRERERERGGACGFGASCYTATHKHAPSL